jgi:polysaccharide pyruvyl transferase WcaK-like protein
VLLNDTSFAAHHGSRHVIETIRSCLSDRGTEITASVASGKAWNEMGAVLQAIEAADVIVINGEGTLHHGAEAGDLLMNAVNHPLCREKPLVLINTLWQDNPESWTELVKDIDLIVVRDGRSQNALASAGLSVSLCPDLSFYRRFPAHGEPLSQRTAFGDSVYRDVSEQLMSAYCAFHGPKIYLPIRSSHRHQELARGLSFRGRIDNLKHRAKVTARRLLDSGYRQLPNVEAYVSELSTCSFHITGRYHAACLSIVARVPFVAVASNSWKIEALVDDIGLDRKRIVSSTAAAVKQGMLPYHPAELDNIKAWLGLSRVRTESLFDTITQLAVSRVRASN